MHPQRRSDLTESTAPNRNKGRNVKPNPIRQFLGQRLLAALLGVSSVGPAMAAPLQLPALVEPASQEHHVGKVIFVELVTPDLAAAKQFYAGLFGWTYRDIQVGGKAYAAAFLDGRPVAGLFHNAVLAGERRQPAWLTFVAVRDVDAAKTIALQHGAKVLFVPHCIPDRGCEAVFADPQGAVFAVLASTQSPDRCSSRGNRRSCRPSRDRERAHRTRWKDHSGSGRFPWREPKVT